MSDTGDCEALRLLVLAGSLRQPSRTRTLLGQISDQLDLLGATVHRWDLRDRPLPPADPEFHDAPERNPDATVQRLVAEAQACDGFVLGSPVYHNSYSAALKNALDHLAIPQFHYKPVALAGDGAYRSTQAVDHLRGVVRGLLGIAVPTQVCTSALDYAEQDGHYVVSAPDILPRVHRQAVELILFAQLLQPLRAAARAA